MALFFEKDSRKIIIEERDMGLYIIDFKDVRWVVPIKGEVDTDEYGVNWG